MDWVNEGGILLVAVVVVEDVENVDDKSLTVIALVERSGVDGGGGGGRLEEREGGWGDKGGQEQPDEVLLKNTKINTAQTSSLTKI